MAGNALLVVSTFPEIDAARIAVRALVEEGLAACGNLVPQVESIYRWQGKVETAAEILLLLKTTSDRYPALEQRLLALHPYEVPEIISLEIRRGAEAYLRWITESCA